MWVRIAVVVLVATLGMAPAARADLAGVVNQARLQGCRATRTRDALRGNPQLIAAADGMANGQSLHASLAAAGYSAAHSSAVHVSGARADVDVGRILANSYCTTLTDPTLTELGALRRGGDVYIVFAAPAPLPKMADAADISREILARVNEARANGHRCGNRALPPAPALTLHAALSAAALAHSQEMAKYAEFDHRGHDGSSPAMRVQRAGYGNYGIVGENIAAGAMTPREVVEGWLASPAHCENIMDGRFTHMGIAFAVNLSSTELAYWTQEFAAPSGRHQ